jgi:ATP-dependent DNA helicase DinG
LATLPQVARPAVWDLVQSDAHNCMGKRCPNYKPCFYQAARRRMEHGDLLVCNHALFFSDLALRINGVGFLPPYDHVILDEAHSVEDVAADHFGVSLTEGQVSHLLGLLYHPRTGHGFLASLTVKDGSPEAVDTAIEATLRCRNRATELFDSLWRWQRDGGPPNGRITEPGVVEDVLSGEMKQLAAQLKALRERAATEADEFELNSYAQRASDVAASAATLIGQQIEDCVYWLEGGEGAVRVGRRRTGSGRERISLHGKPIDVAPLLRERLFGQSHSVVMTSATLAVGRGDFSHIVARLGCDDAHTRQLGSPFDHAAQVALIVDRSMPEPNHPEYVEQLCPRIERHVRETDGGAFVLFTSFQMLDRVAKRLRPMFQQAGYPTHVHGQDGPPGLMLKRFREDERSVLLGTASFWQGVDVRGRGLRNVIITRLPFDVPDRPLIQARHERIERDGGNPFMEDQVPRAVIRFRQGFGRLIRSATDAGRVVILDPRIVTKRYGRLFLDALPEGIAVDYAHN